jgi:pimeloyl-ACP methyl ester carboxylesterase
MTKLRFILFAGLSVLCLPVRGATGSSSAARSAPPPGIAIVAVDRAALETATTELSARIAQLRQRLADNPKLLGVLPDVEIYHKAVHWALAYDEFYRSNDVAIARALLNQGLERARQLQAGQAPWLTATGLVVRGYVSKIDGSVQPYGLVVPASFARSASSRHRLDVWLHGRDNHLTELKFISDRQRSSGEFTPPDTFVLHPYGRYCNAFKFAGEIDVFEATEQVRRQYPIDQNRIAIRGFSMGGAGCWHLAAHHAGFWAAAAPGAGFAETAEYTKALAKEPKPPWYEQKLWQLYDATDYALNLFNCPTIAYSGELDKQKQAAEVMARAMKADGLDLVHLIGPGVEHRYEPKTKLELARRVDEVVEHGRSELWEPVRFTTRTLRYNQMRWVTVDALDRHWERADLSAKLIAPRVSVSTTNVAAFTLALPRHLADLSSEMDKPAVLIDGQALRLTPPRAEPWLVHLQKRNARWSVVQSTDETGLRKRHGLQGPIDDAFMDSFLVVRPTGQPLNGTVGAWLLGELAHATNEWRAQFRGDARVKDDVAVTAHDIAANHLILWGDPQSNRILGRVAKRLPLRWDATQVRLGRMTFPSSNSVPLLIYPNPLNPNRYVVLNSGFTFCEYGSASNAQQTPKLPDLAVLDIATPRTERLTRGIQYAGFFGERWESIDK